MTTDAAALVPIGEIEAARERIRDEVRVTPVLRKVALTNEFGVPVFLKAEHLQRTGSFKLRGALNLFRQLDADQLAAGAVAASAGNHAQGVAVAASVCGSRARIFMPIDATLSKIEATRSYGAEVVLTGETVLEALGAAVEWAAENRATVVHPFDDMRIIAGQGTVGLEILEQVPDVGTVVVPIGGGGLAAGVISAIRALRPQVRIVGVQAAACSSLQASLAAGSPTSVHLTPTMADGIAIKQPGGNNFPILRDGLDDIVTVDDDAIGEAILWLIERSKQVVEGAGAVALAALMTGQVAPVGPTVLILSGGNIDPMQLISVIRHGLTSAGRFVRLETHLPDRPGELSKLLMKLADLRVNVLNVDHRREGVSMAVGQARIDLTLQTRDAAHIAEVIDKLRAAGYSARTVQ